MHALKLVPAILLFVASAKAFGGVNSHNEYVRLEVRSTFAEIRPGASGVIEFRFYPADGIHVNIEPPVEFAPDSAAPVILRGKPVMTMDARTGYLSTTVPVTQQVALGQNVVEGPFTVKGTVTFYFCSDAEGWCNRQKQPVEFTIVVKP